MKFNINKKLYNKILKKFKVVKVIDTADYDFDIELLENTIKTFENYTFENNQRILIFYQDTGFYHDLNSGTSVILNNLFCLLKKYAIPSEFLIFFTNHYGIKKEIDLLNKKTGYSITKIIECSLWHDYPTCEQIEFSKKLPLEFENKFLYTCLNNRQRIHRSYTLCKLKENNLLDRGIISYRFKE